MDLTILIVNWNSADYLRKCLNSIFAQKTDLDFEVIIVDNASYDGSDLIVKDEFPGVKFIQSEENLGFAKANNLAFQFSSGRILLFLNPDTEIMDSGLNAMFSSLESIPEAGVIGCRLLNSDMSLQTSCVQSFPTILNQILDVEYLRVRFPGLKFWGIRALFFYKGSPEEVEAVSGACLMIKRDVFQKVNLFSTDYFMYSEDIDLCYKVRKAGFKVFYTDEAKVIHHGGQSVKNTQVNYFSILLMRESLLKFLKTTKGSLYGDIYRITMALAAILRLIMIIGIMPVGIFIFGRKAIVNSFNKWKTIFLWAIFLETAQLP